jgi:archaellum component FlaC
MKAIEDELLRLNTEKDRLTSEYDKMPPHSGRTLLQRQRKQELESRISDIEKEISQLRLTLKRNGFR